MLEVAKNECEAHGVAITTKRVNVYSILISAKKAVSAYELAESYECTFEEPVPVITVYRVLDFFQRNRLVHKLQTANKYVACSHIDRKHTHDASQFLICKKCLKVTELGISPVKFNELKHTLERAGFHLDEPQLEMSCICNNCYIEE